MDGKDDYINKDEFPSQQANGDAEEAFEPDAGSDEPAIPEIEAPVVSGQPEENTALQQPPESADSKKPAFSEFFDETTVRILLDDDFNLIFVLDTLRQGVFGYADGDSLFGKDGSLLPCLQHHQKACAGNPVSGFIKEL